MGFVELQSPSKKGGGKKKTAQKKMKVVVCECSAFLVFRWFFFALFLFSRGKYDKSVLKSETLR